MYTFEVVLIAQEQLPSRFCKFLVLTLAENERVKKYTFSLDPDSEVNVFAYFPLLRWKQFCDDRSRVQPWWSCNNGLNFPLRLHKEKETSQIKPTQQSADRDDTAGVGCFFTKKSAAASTPTPILISCFQCSSSSLLICNSGLKKLVIITRYQLVL